MAVVNTYIMYKKTPNTDELTLKQFLTELSTNLLSSHLSKKRQAQHDGLLTARLQERLFPDKMEAPRQCAVCPAIPDLLP